MRYLIVADVHANLEAFTAVLDAAKSGGDIAAVWCLGDMVGYGPDPGACLALLRGYANTAVAGNHDLAAINKMDTSEFNEVAAAAVEWTAQKLTPDDRHFLETLPLKALAGDFTLVHGSPRDPAREYIVSVWDAAANLEYFDTRYCLVGHSHVPFLFELRKDTPLLGALPPGLHLGDSRLIINPGGVGQPRDGDPRASFAIFDSNTNTIEHHRVPYDIATTQRKMLRAGLPQSLAIRLSYGK